MSRAACWPWWSTLRDCRKSGALPKCSSASLCCPRKLHPIPAGSPRSYIIKVVSHSKCFCKCPPHPHPPTSTVLQKSGNERFLLSLYYSMRPEMFAIYCMFIFPSYYSGDIMGKMGAFQHYVQNSNEFPLKSQ